MSFAYPECRTAANGPCQLQTSSEDACSKIYSDITDLYKKRYCQCTNGYYNRSSECWNDCYHASATSIDLVSISRESRLVDLNCESYSLAGESEAAFYSSLSAASISRDATTTSGQNLSSTTTGLASQGPAAGQITPLPTSWVDRPSSTGQIQQGIGVSDRGGVRFNVLVTMTVVLAMMSAVC